MTMIVPFNNLSELHCKIKTEIVESISNVIDKSAFISGSETESFEIAFAKKLGVKHCIGVGSGTSALWISLKMSGIGIGDEVIVPANTFFACAEAVELCGAIPVFIDNDECFNIDITKIESSINENTKAIMAVHLYGQMCDVDEILKICNKYDLLLIEDCSQSHFAKSNGKFAGTFGDCACFSFYPGKNLGAMGDAGCIVTNNDSLAEKCRLFRNHGEEGKSKHTIIGFNSRMDGFQSAVLKIKLAYIHDWNKKREELAQEYISRLMDCSFIQLPLVQKGNTHAFHLFVIKAERRDNLKIFLQESGINTGIHYPTPLPFLPVYKSKYNDDRNLFPNASANENILLSLPIYPDLSTNQIDYVTDKIKEFYK